MRAEIIGVKGTWREIANACNTTINKDAGDKEISSAWKYKMLYSEHSPLRQLIIKWKWINLKYWVSVHLVRHNIGIQHYVGTQRTDRTGVNRDELLQSNLVTHECEANAQAIINISRKRLCKQASKETRDAWTDFLGQLSEHEPELANVCVAECIYRNGFCPEFKPCGYNKSHEAQMIGNMYLIRREQHDF